MRRTVVLLLAMGLLAGCSATSSDDGDPAAQPAVTSTSVAQTCPPQTASTATTSSTSAAGDFDGDGRPDRLVTGRVGAGGPWRVRMELAGGGGAEAELPATAEGVKAIGGANVDVGPAQVAFAAVGGSAAGANVGLFVLRSCQVQRVTMAGQPAEFAVGTSAAARSGLACQVPGLVAYDAMSTDGRFFTARTTSYLLVGGIVDEVHRAASTLGTDDAALKPYGAFTCGSLTL